MSSRCLQVSIFLVCGIGSAFVAGCGDMPQTGPPRAEGPGHRPQALALNAYQELNLGQQAFEEVLKKYPRVNAGPAVERVRAIGKKIATAAEIDPLEREINYRLKGFHFEWEFVVLENNQVNAFCLPGGKVAVFTGLIPVVQGDGRIDDNQLATVMAHEIAHALAHHSSERLAREQKYHKAMEALNGALGRMSPETRKELIGLLGAGAEVNSLSYDRQQESEADHIGLFLMTFAGYDPRAAVPFWEKMQKLSAGGHKPEILSDHPSDARRITQIKRWVPNALSAYDAYKAGRIAPAKEGR